MPWVGWHIYKNDPVMWKRNKSNWSGNGRVRHFPRWLEKKVMWCQSVKKESTNLIRNYHPISLLSIFSKIIERLIFNYLFNYFLQNKRFTECQSVFIHGEPCVAQLPWITHEIYKTFDCKPPADTKGIILNISKAFNKVWREGLIIKLKTYGIDGDVLKLLINYLEDHKQRVVLNEQTSSWKNILDGFPQGSVLGPILFLNYINDLSDFKRKSKLFNSHFASVKNARTLPKLKYRTDKGLHYGIWKIFAGDTSLFSKVKDKNYSTVELNNYLKIMSNWAFQWKKLFNPNPNKQAVEILFSKKAWKSYPSLNFNGDNVQKAII